VVGILVGIRHQLDNFAPRFAVMAAGVSDDFVATRSGGSRVGEHVDHADVAIGSWRHRPGKAVAMAVDLAQTQVDCLRDRLIQAADDELAEFGTLTGRFEAVAHRAGVSRATAYRQMGSVSELLTRVGLRRARKYLAGLQEVIDGETGAMNKLEASLIYGAQVLPGDPIVLNLIARQFTSGRDPEVYELVDELVRPTVTAGQRCGELRDDIDAVAIMDYIVEQSYFATHARDRSVHAVSQRFRLFIEPAIAPRAADRTD
jgi:AcrR family transcriptional regulator